jgi:hypothetical protein
MWDRPRKSDVWQILLGQGLRLMQSQSGCWSQVAYNPIALEFKEACSHHAFKSLVEAKQPTIWARQNLAKTH